MRPNEEFREAGLIDDWLIYVLYGREVLIALVVSDGSRFDQYGSRFDQSGVPCFGQAKACARPTLS